MTLPEDRRKFIANIANNEWAYDLPQHESDADNDKEYANQEAKWSKIRDDYLATSDNAEELHEFVKQHHWGGADDFLILIENQACDSNTARLIFWLSGPEFFRRKFANSEAAEYDHDKNWMNLILRCTENLVNGKYQRAAMPEDYKENIPLKDQSWEAEPLWEIHPMMYGES